MRILYQGEAAETAATTLAELLAEKSVDASKSIVECDGGIYAPGADISSVPLAEGASVEVFRLAAGG